MTEEIVKFKDLSAGLKLLVILGGFAGTIQLLGWLFIIYLIGTDLLLGVT